MSYAPTEDVTKHFPAKAEKVEKVFIYSGLVIIFGSLTIGVGFLWWLWEILHK